MKMGKSIRGALSYNEQKVSEGKANLLFASRFSRDITEMGFSEKLLRFQKLTQLNERCKTNTLHLSLNFATEENIESSTLHEIAAEYMKRIGFGTQPYLVYEHHDTAHQHIHIVTTTIRPNGRSVFLHNIGRRLSEPARKAIEDKFGLVKAENRRKQNQLSSGTTDLKVAEYGKAETKRTVSNIVREVVASYKFSSLSELNAVLRQYNVIADPGEPGTRMQLNRGLVYSLIDSHGQKTGIPIKASSIYSKPTLMTLEKRFAQNAMRKVKGKDFVAGTVRYALAHSRKMDEFSKLLGKNSIGYCVLKLSHDSEGAYFIDNRNKVVFSCRDLALDNEQVLSNFRTLGNVSPEPGNVIVGVDRPQIGYQNDRAAFDLLKNLLALETANDYVSPEFLKRKKKKRKH